MHLVNHDVWMRELRAKLPTLVQLSGDAQVTLAAIAAEDWPSADGKASLTALRDYTDGLLQEWERTDLNRKNLTLNAAAEAVDEEGHLLNADGTLPIVAVTAPPEEMSTLAEPVVTVDTVPV